MSDRQILVAAMVLLGVAAAAQELPVDPDKLDPPPDPLELRLVHETECMPGWRRVAQDDGYIVIYRTSTGYPLREWVSERKLAVHFTRADGSVVEDALAIARTTLTPAHRITCRWQPLILGGEAAQ